MILYWSRFTFSYKQVPTIRVVMTQAGWRLSLLNGSTALLILLPIPDYLLKGKMSVVLIMISQDSFFAPSTTIGMMISKLLIIALPVIIFFQCMCQVAECRSGVRHQFEFFPSLSLWRRERRPRLSWCWLSERAPSYLHKHVLFWKFVWKLKLA